MLFDTPPPGVGLKTVMGIVPIAARSPAEVVTVKDPLLINVVGRSVPPQRTVDNVENPAPLTVMMLLTDPVAILSGLIAVITGVGSDDRAVPVRLTVLGLFEPSVEIVSDPMRLPGAVGVNFTLMEQFPFTASVVPQVVV